MKNGWSFKGKRGFTISNLKKSKYAHTHIVKNTLINTYLIAYGKEVHLHSTIG